MTSTGRQIHGTMLRVLFSASALVASGAQASVTISLGKTEHMVCSAGTCAPTAAKAVLNASDLETLLASGSAKVTTTGSGVQANDIVISAPLSWSTASGLALDAYRALKINMAVTVGGVASLTILTNDGGSGGSLSFGAKGNVAFQNLSSGLSINGTAYSLVGTISTLAAAIANEPGGNFALAANYDASADGTYASSPIPTTFTGQFEGLGNSIANLSINAPNGGAIGLFTEVDAPGRISDARLIRFTIQATDASLAGGLVAANNGTLSGDFADGKIIASSDSSTSFGILAGINAGGTISNSHSSGSLRGGSVGSDVGGLIGTNYDGGTVDSSFSTVSANSNALFVGGLVGNMNVDAFVSNSYATGALTGGSGAYVGGLLGCLCAAADTVSDSYSTGRVKGGTYLGGLIGDYSNGTITGAYWDTTTSGITNLGQGAGNTQNVGGITGLTTKQLQAGLPAGFDPSIWGEKRKINGGLPYLLATPPSR